MRAFQRTRTTQWAAVGILVMAAAMVVVTAGMARARGDGRWPATFPASFWSGATWHEATAAERRSYVLGITDGLRLAALLDRAQVDLGPVGQCVQGMSAEPLVGAVGGYLDRHPIEQGDDPIVHLHVWDGLVATCRDYSAPQDQVPRRERS
jgi:hypothetical protein